MRRAARSTLLLALLAAALPAAAAQTLYKWTDADGVVHYSATPPPDGARASEVKLRGEPAARDSDTAAARTDADADADATDTAAADGDAARQRNCAIARANIATLKASDEVRLGDAASAPLTPEQRATELARMEKLADALCDDAPDGDGSDEIP